MDIVRTMHQRDGWQNAELIVNVNRGSCRTHLRKSAEVDLREEPEKTLLRYTSGYIGQTKGAGIEGN